MFLIPGRRLEKDEGIYSDWVYTAAENVIVRAEAFDAEDTTSVVTITFYTKNSEDTGNGEAVEDVDSNDYTLTLTGGDTGVVEKNLVSGNLNSSSTGPYGTKEMVRLKIECTVGWSTIRVFEPIFYDTAI